MAKGNVIPKNDQIIMVVRRDRLFLKDDFQGFRPASKVNYESRILDHFAWMRRGNAEEDPSFKQPIGYCMVVNPSLRKVFTYQRASKHDEQRLAENNSIGAGGHIERPDVKPGIDGASNPLHASMLRELREEVGMPKYPDPKVLGYINDDDNPVGQVHIGVLYLAETDSPVVKARGDEMSRGGLIPLGELEEICTQAKHQLSLPKDQRKVTADPWTLIALEPLKRYFAHQPV